MSSMKDMERKFIINTYNRDPKSTPLFVKGKGAYVEDEKGQIYLDFLSGLGVNNLGHCHPAVVKAVTEQANRLIHTSNLYYTEPQIELSRLLIENSSLDKVFFSNSGAEANEGAIKLARKFFQGRGENKFEIISFKNSFHGRTLATVTATGQEKYHEGFKPLLPGIRYAQFNDLDSVEKLINQQTCAVLVEPIQGEGGINPASEEFLKGLKDLCNKKGVLLIFDEVQCGIGRTGKLFAYENYNVIPDILTLAKSLGGGLPIGAMLAKEDVANAFKPGDHASTFGGNPLACAAGCAVIKTLICGLLEEGRLRGESLMSQLKNIKSPLIKEVRGIGLMIGVEIEKGEEVFKGFLDKKILCNLIAGKTLRFLPPLVITEKEEEKVISSFKEILEELG